MLKVYINDTATYSNTFKNHLEDLRKTFEATQAAGLKLKAKKCHFLYWQKLSLSVMLLENSA